jgi:hypothetical protein
MKNSDDPHWTAVLWNAIRNMSLDHYPAVKDASGNKITVEKSQTIRRLLTPLAALTGDNIDDKLREAREALEEAKALSDYQDAKTVRLLGILVCVSVVAGLLFGRFADGYPLYRSIQMTSYAFVQKGLVLACYSSFAAFICLAACGVLTIIYAMRMRFKYPVYAKQTGTKSSLFHRPTADTGLESWIVSLLDTHQEKFKAGMKIEYLKACIVETYLVSAKIADELHYLMPAQRLHYLSITCMMLWLLLLSITLSIVPVM